MNKFTSFIESIFGDPVTIANRKDIKSLERLIVKESIHKIDTGCSAIVDGKISKINSNFCISGVYNPNNSLKFYE